MNATVDEEKEVQEMIASGTLVCDKKMIQLTKCSPYLLALYRKKMREHEELGIGYYLSTLIDAPAIIEIMERKQKDVEATYDVIVENFIKKRVLLHNNKDFVETTIFNKSEDEKINDDFCALLEVEEPGLSQKFIDSHMVQIEAFEKIGSFDLAKKLASEMDFLAEVVVSRYS